MPGYLFARTLTFALLLAVAALGIDRPAAVADPPDGPFFPREIRSKKTQRAPWPRRFRGGVRVMPAEMQQVGPAALRLMGLDSSDLRDLGMHPRELRRLGLRPPGQGLVDIRLWPPEPPPPTSVDPAKLAKALRTLCPPMIPPERLKRYAYFMVKFGTEFNVDPFLLGGLVYQQSRCRERRQNSYGVGLAMINVAMHRPRFDKGHYRYWAHDGGTWKPQRLPKNRFRFTRRSLLRPKANIYFAAKLMSVFQRQCPHMDGLFQSVPHRHPVSHFIWGDRVRGAGVEDRILTDRRRLLEYYHGTRSRALGKFGDLRLACPMDGAPRKLTSGMGDDRERGKRRHTGVDFGSDWGEPVRSVAAGKVILAGVDRGRNQLQSLEPPLTRLVPAARMGPRGLLIKIRHPGGLITEYMHLSAYVVRTGEEVKRGQLLGYVGRSGMKDSMAHLHFGMVFGGKHIDPIPHLRAYVFGPDATYVGRRNADKQRRRRMRRQSVRRAMRAARYLRRWRRARPETQERGEDQGPAAAPARRRRELGPPAQP